MLIAPILINSPTHFSPVCISWACTPLSSFFVLFVHLSWHANTRRSLIFFSVSPLCVLSSPSITRTDLLHPSLKPASLSSVIPHFRLCKPSFYNVVYLVLSHVQVRTNTPILLLYSPPSVRTGPPPTHYHTFFFTSLRSTTLYYLVPFPRTDSIIFPLPFQCNPLGEKEPPRIFGASFFYTPPGSLHIILIPLFLIRHQGLKKTRSVLWVFDVVKYISFVIFFYFDRLLLAP